MRALIPFCLLLWAGLSPAVAGDAILNSDVTVDATGKDAADARTIAMGKANADGLRDLLGRLGAPEQADLILSTIDTKKLASIVRGTEVLEEKIGDNRYRARLRISFDADEISALVSKFSDPSQAALPSKTTAFLFIPAYEEDGAAMLWEEKNPWRGIWKMLGLEANSGDVIVPYGDSGDQAVISLSNLATVPYSALTPFALRYGVSDIILLNAKYVKSPDMTLTVNRRRVSRLLNETSVLTYRADPQETRDMLLARAARDIVDGLQNRKMEQIATTQSLHTGERGRLMMLASITTLDSWTILKQKLSTLPMIEKMEILAMSSQQVDMIVHYRGSQESLANAISGVGLRLLKQTDYWVLSSD